MGRDQGENAARVVAAGAGLKLKRKVAASRIKGAVTRVLEDHSYRDAAQRMAGAIAEGAGDTDPIGTVERLLAARTRTARPTGGRCVADSDQ